MITHKPMEEMNFDDLSWFVTEHTFLLETIEDLKNKIAFALEANRRMNDRAVEAERKAAKYHRDLKEYYDDRNAAFNKFEKQLEDTLNERDKWKKRWHEADEIIQTFMRRNKP